MSDIKIIENINIAENYRILPLTTKMTRWIKDGPRNSNYGHFEQSIDNNKITIGSIINIDYKEYTILKIINNGTDPYSILLNKNPDTGRIRYIKNLNLENNNIINLNYIPTNEIIPNFDYIDFFGTGTTTNTITGQINTYAYLTSNVSKDSTTLILNSSSGFSIGDEIFIHQTQTNDDSNLGISEFAIIDDVINNTLILKSPIKNYYLSGTFNARPSQVTQIIRVPNYENATINSGNTVVPKSWDGYSGGILVFKVKDTLINNGIISANGTGFRAWGGAPYSGESYYGYTVNGGLEWGNGGRCGGGHWASGLEHYWSIGGGPGLTGLIHYNENRFSLGGGGGTAIGTYCGTPTYLGGSGGRGGGIIIIYAKKIINNGTIYSRGNNGGNGKRYSNGTSCAANGAGGGGGAGGGIIIKSINIENNGTIDTYRGTGGTKYASSANGSTGNNGYIRINSGSNLNTAPNYYTSYNSETLKIYVENMFPSTIIYSLNNVDRHRLDQIAVSVDNYNFKCLFSFNNELAWEYFDFNNNIWTSCSIEDIYDLGIQDIDMPNLDFSKYEKNKKYDPSYLKIAIGLTSIINPNRYALNSSSIIVNSGRREESIYNFPKFKKIISILNNTITNYIL